MTIERLGLVALTYVFVAVVVVAVRDYLFRDRALTRFVVTLAASLSVCLMWTVYSRIFYDRAESLFAELAVGVLLASVYTAAWAPLVHGGLTHMSRTFGLVRPRYTYAG